MSRSSPSSGVRIEIPLYRDVLIVGWMTGTMLPALSVGYALLFRPSEGARLGAYGWYTATVVASFLVLVVVLRLWRRLWIELVQGEIRFGGRLPERRLPVAGLRRLSLVDLGMLGKVISIETASERILVSFFARGIPPSIEAALDELEARTGLVWRGRGVDRSRSGRATLPEFWRAWKAAVGGTRWAWWRWLLGHAFGLRIDEVGVNSAFLRWGNAILTSSAFVFAFMLVIGVSMAAAGFHAMATVGSLTLFFLGWSIVSVGFNVILLFIGREVRERESIEADVIAAREVQQRLLPAAAPSVPGLEVAGSCRPAREVGGDYFDYFPSDDGGRLAVAVADVAGKGLAAGLLMTLVKGALSTGVATLGDLRAAVIATARHIRSAPGDRRFVTLVLAELDPAGDVLRLVRAGHLPPLLVHADGTSEWLAPDGIALGMGRDGLFAKTCEVAEVPFTGGDLVVLYTDGVTEALGEAGEEFGDERLRDAVVRRRHLGCGEICRGLLDELARFRGGAAVTDDVTLIVARRSPFTVPERQGTIDF